MGTFEYLEDGVTADLTFRAAGHDLKDLFIACADAAANAIVEDLGSIRISVRKTVHVRADTLDILLLRFLDELIFYKDAEGLILRASAVSVQPAAGGYELTADLAGEPLEPERHRRSADVKAVTLHGLRVEETSGGWEAQVTVDV